MPSAAPQPPAAAAPTRIPKPAEASEARRVRESTKPVVIVAVLLGAFFLMQSWIPLRSAVQIGADEGFEVAKATLCLHGHKLYSEVWNDQPPLHTWLITQVLKLQRVEPLTPSLSPSDGERVVFRPGEGFVRAHQRAGILPPYIRTNAGDRRESRRHFCRGGLVH